MPEHPERRDKVNRVICLADGSDFTLADGIACPVCGETVRAIDAEPLRPGVRLLCPQHHLIVCFELTPR